MLKGFARLLRGGSAIRHLLQCFLLAAALTRVDTALACSCWHPTPHELIDAHALIFAGMVSEVDQRAGWAIFAVQKIYKGGVSGGSITVRFNNGPGSICGIAFNAGETHTVFATHARTEQGEVFHTHLCSMIPYLSSPYRFQPALDAYALRASAGREESATPRK